MAKYRLRTPHEVEVQDGSQRVWLPGDVTNESLGDERGALVGDGTPYRVRWPTLEMIPLDDEARAAIAEEEERLRLNQATMNPIDELPIGPDDYEERYIPGMEGVQRRAPKPDGAPIRNRQGPQPKVEASPLNKSSSRARDSIYTGASPDDPAEISPQHPPTRDPPPPAPAELPPLTPYSPPPRAAFGKPPFGYRFENGKTVEDPDQQRALVEMKRMGAAHYPARVIAEKLKQAGLPAPSPYTIRDILKRGQRK